MADWRALIRRCFGIADGRFALHDDEQDVAYELLGALRAENVKWEDVEEAFEDWLAHRTPNARGHSQSELIRVKAFLEPWLDHR
jgi:hypothetical protein